MVPTADDSPRLSTDAVALLAQAAGIPIAPSRLPDVTAVLAELFALETKLDELDLSGIEPLSQEVDWPETVR
jgi:hypothetical protein